MIYFKKRFFKLNKFYKSGESKSGIIGAFDFLEKPIALQKLLKTVSLALKHGEQLPKTSMNLTSLGKSPIMLAVKERLDKIAQSNQLSPVLLIGPHGSCAELCARFLHKPDTPWLHLTELGQLVSAPMTILEAIQDGVVFISEVADLGKIEQKGLALLIAKSEKYRVRVICGTAKHLPQLQSEGLFETALLQLLSGVSLRLPALDEHKEDIPDLAVAMANIHFEGLGAEYREFDIAALNALRNAAWPGDLAQLDAAIHNLIETSLGEKITLDDVNRVLFQFDQVPHQAAARPLLQPADVENKAASEHSTVNFDQPLREARDDFERQYFEYHLKANANNMSKLAEVSGLERTHLYRKLKQLGVNPKG